MKNLEGKIKKLERKIKGLSKKDSTNYIEISNLIKKQSKLIHELIGE